MYFISLSLFNISTIVTTGCSNSAKIENKTNLILVFCKYDPHSHLLSSNLVVNDAFTISSIENELPSTYYST